MGLRVVELPVQAIHLGRDRVFGLLLTMNPWKGDTVKLWSVWLTYFLSQVPSSSYSSGEGTTK